ncbi:hypothetical protein BKA64DRAFT_674007 [Cadophora sp. MPI-SDFR-AT-0126]|nr:hypothetical protein BKA64DRAFT_674007 [Leotiomycetes sp. MPI-SDFR-AT-0126]
MTKSITIPKKVQNEAQDSEDGETWKSLPSFLPSFILFLFFSWPRLPPSSVYKKVIPGDLSSIYLLYILLEFFLSSFLPFFWDSVCEKARVVVELVGTLGVMGGRREGGYEWGQRG